MKLNIGISPCPNDTVMFHHMINEAVPEGLDINLQFADVEHLNQAALRESFEVTKLSFPAYFKVSETYELLTCGAALGRGVGPLLISDSPLFLESLEGGKIALPGELTTANMLTNFALNMSFESVFEVFHEIEELVLSRKVDAGVIIHENRFTYQDKGLYKVMDLGEYWEKKTGLPIPLGGIAVKRSLPTEVKKQINAALKASVVEGRKLIKLPSFVTSNAQEMSEEVMRKHIDLYVNDFSEEIGEEGKNAILKVAETLGYSSETAEKYVLK